VFFPHILYTNNTFTGKVVALKESDAMKKRRRTTRFNRREFVAGAATLALGRWAQAELSAGKEVSKSGRDVYIVPNFHPASCGWLTTFSKERVYCVNSYFSHLDRVRDDPQYEFVMSEVNNVIGVMNFRPERVVELKQRVQEKRVELVNAFFLESTINLSGGEALVRLGVEGLLWYEKMFGVRPKYAWCIDTCGVHDQMAQIAKGLGLKALIYTRKNPTGKTMYWTASPDGSQVLTLCPGDYSQASSIFESKTPLTSTDLDKLEKEFATKESTTPENAAVLILGGGGDYSVAPKMKDYPSTFLTQWAQSGIQRKLRFATLTKYLDAVTPGVDAGSTKIPTHLGGTAYDFDSFWMDCPKVKTWYRSCEQQLQSAESLATIASLTGSYVYPTQSLYESWVLMFLNMDRNTLWGSAGGMVFVSAESWDVQDRFEWVAKSASQVQISASDSLAASGDELMIFNPLNWKRNDPLELTIPAGKTISDSTCEQLPDGRILCTSSLAAMSVGSMKLISGAPEKAKTIQVGDTIETSHYVLKMDAQTGAIASLKIKKSGREILGAQANVINAERPRKKPDDPADHMPPIPERERLATSSEGQSTIEVNQGPLTTTITVTGKFFGGGTLRRTTRLYESNPRIDFETELNDIPNYTVVYADFPLVNDIDEVWRGVPFGFSHASWSKPNPNLHGWAKGIVPAVRWSAYAVAGGLGVAILDRGLSGRELNGRTASIYLLNAEDKYWGYDNPWLTGKGTHVLQFALLPYESAWRDARIPQAAWEYNLMPAVVEGRGGLTDHTYLETSGNVIVESLRRENGYIVIRLVEAFGLAGEAWLKLSLPHKNAAMTDLAGRGGVRLPAGPEYRFAIRPQQIVTIQFATASTVGEETPVSEWDKFVPQGKLKALHAYSPELIGHPPFGA
jgi:alpha-mannosidase